MLLVVTNKSDLASDFLILRLKERNVPFIRLNTEDLGKSFQVNMFLDGDTVSLEIEFADSRTLSQSDISSVYIRQPISPEISFDVTESDRVFARRESKELLRSLWRLIDRRKWLNHPTSLWRASNKVEQLSVARNLGFKIPATCVSASEQIIRQFIETYEGRAICKAVKHGFLRKDGTVQVATTQRVGQEFCETISDFARVPMIFQEEIVKAFDVRVTVVGEKLFATAIHSQEHPETTVDWRLWDIHDIQLRHEPFKLSSRIEDLCLMITKHYELTYSAIDLVMSQRGEYVFLELNPNGQWAWIEQTVGHPVRDALIDWLNGDHLAVR